MGDVAFFPPLDVVERRALESSRASVDRRRSRRTFRDRCLIVVGGAALALAFWAFVVLAFALAGGGS